MLLLFGLSTAFNTTDHQILLERLVLLVSLTQLKTENIICIKDTVLQILYGYWFKLM